MKKNKILNPGWTLIEMILAMAILSVIGLSLYATFSQGLAIWKRVTGESANEDINIFLDKFTHDLHSTFTFETIPFEGKEEEVAFPAFLEENTRDGKSQTIGRLTYFFDAKQNALKKRQSSYSQLYENKKGPEQILAKHVDSVKFLYYYYIKGLKEYAWTAFWPLEEPEKKKPEDEKKIINIPLAVRIEFEGHNGAVKYAMTRTIVVPVGYYQLREEDE